MYKQYGLVDIGFLMDTGYRYYLVGSTCLWDWIFSRPY